MREKVRRERRKKSEELVLVVMFKVVREEGMSVRKMYVEGVVYKGIKGGGKWCD
jgi:hypothetical protein